MMTLMLPARDDDLLWTCPPFRAAWAAVAVAPSGDGGRFDDDEGDDDDTTTTELLLDGDEGTIPLLLLDCWRARYDLSFFFADWSLSSRSFSRKMASMVVIGYVVGGGLFACRGRLWRCRASSLKWETTG